MAYMIDAEKLISEFAHADGRMPLIVFALLSIYLDEGPFEFDASVLADRLSETNLKARVNPEELAALQPHIERFFEPGSDGWRPRADIFGGQDRRGTAELGSIPGEAIS